MFVRACRKDEAGGACGASVVQYCSVQAEINRCTRRVAAGRELQMRTDDGLAGGLVGSALSGTVGFRGRNGRCLSGSLEMSDLARPQGGLEYSPAPTRSSN